MSNATSFWYRLRLTASVRTDFYSALASMTGPAGRIPLGQALQEAQIEFAKQKHLLHPLLQEILNRMKGGGKRRSQSLKLGDVLIGLVPPNEAMMIKAGEERGDPAMGLVQAAKHVRNEAELMSIVRGGLFLVMLYTVAMIAIYFFFSLQIIPQMEQAAPRHLWPQSARQFAFVADNIVFFSAALLSTLIALYFGFEYLKNNLTGRTRNFLDDHIWPFTTTRLINSSAVLSSLSGFIRAGVPFQMAIDAVSQNSNRYLNHKFSLVRKSIKQGKSDYVSLLSCQLIPQERAWMVSLYGRTSDFGQSLEHIADEFIKFSVAKTKTITSFVSIAGLVVVAASISWVAISLYAIVGSVK